MKQLALKSKTGNALLIAISILVVISVRVEAQFWMNPPVIQGEVAFEEGAAVFRNLEQCVGRISTKGGQGTAFIVRLSKWADRRFVLTAAHVVREAGSATLSMPFAEHDRVARTVPQAIHLKACVDTLPSETGATVIWQAYDIAVITLMTKDIRTNSADSQVYFGSLKTEMFADWTDLTPGQSFTYMGFPLGISIGAIHPLMRFGHIAGVDSGKMQIIADVDFFDGSSGSPAFFDFRDPVCYLPWKKGKRFVGLVLAYEPYRKSLVNPKTGHVEMIQTENSGIGYLLPSPTVKSLLEAIIFKETKGIE